jgi:pimeloyl-ACP methyl ester carboxylesterase
MAALADERVDTAVGKVQVWRAGAGAPVVYLHSAMGEGPGLAFLEALAEDNDVIAPVFPGFADSEGIEQIDDIEDAAFHVLDLLDRLGFATVPLVGLSLGGWIAAEVATRYPERVTRLVLINPAGLYVPGAPVTDIFGKPPAELAGVLFADQSHPVAQMMHALAERYDDPAAMADIPLELLLPMVKSMSATAKLGWDPYLHNPKLGRRLHRITSPTLIVHGTEDKLFARGHAEAYAAGINGARLVDVKGAGHLLPLERPEELATLVRAFLAEPPLADGRG